MDVMPKIDSVDFSRHKMYVETPSDTLHIVLNDYDSYTGNWHNNECFVEFSTLNVVKNGIKLMATQLEFFYIMEVYRDAGVHLSGVYNETTRIRFRLNTAWKGYSMFLCVDDFNIFQVGNNKVGDTLNYVTQGWTPVIEINVNGGFVLNK